MLQIRTLIRKIILKRATEGLVQQRFGKSGADSYKINISVSIGHLSK